MISCKGSGRYEGLGVTILSALTRLFDEWEKSDAYLKIPFKL
jgi:hypothetical protein